LLRVKPYLVEPVLLGMEPDAGTSVAWVWSLVLELVLLSVKPYLVEPMLLGMEPCGRTSDAKYRALCWNQHC
jgi:hypothetical protein